MRYLAKREDFIRRAKAAMGTNDLILSINEGTGGPGYNEVMWHDSLIGRLIDHIIRKAKIAFNLMRIKPLIRRLRMEFDRLSSEGMIAKIVTESSSDPYKLMISKLYEELTNLVDNGGNVGEIKRIAKECLNITVKLLPNFKDEEKAELETCKAELEAFIKAIEGLNDDEGGEATDDEDEEEVSTTDDDAMTIARFNNFRHLFKMLIIYQGIRRETAELAKTRATQQAGATQQTGTNTAAPTGTNAGNTTTTTATNTTNTTTGTTQNNSRLYRYDHFMRINEEGVAGTAGKVVGVVYKFITGQKDERKEDPQTAKLMAALGKLWGVFNTQKGVLDRGSEMEKFLDNFTKEKDGKTQTYSKFKSYIDRIYGKVSTSGALKEAVTAMDELLNKSEQIGAIVVEIYNITKTKPNGEFPNKPGVAGEVWDEFCKNVMEFNKTMPLAVEKAAGAVEIKVGDNVSWKSAKTGDNITYPVIRVDGDTLVFKDKKGQEFTKKSREVKIVESLSILLEADEPQTPDNQTPDNQTPGNNTPTPGNNTPTPDKPGADTEPRLIETGTVSERIKDFFDKYCKTVRNYVLDKTEVDKITANIEKLAKEKEGFFIDGFDPVIQIVRLFNRAYKLYTVETISKRKDGTVAPTVYNEYTSLGGRSSSGDLNGWAGPFRNKRIFNTWEDAVLEIMANKKYEFIFSSSTSLRLPKVANPKDPEDYEYRKGAGAKLREFINDVLDGEDFYKAGGSGTEGGAQKKFLERYFGKLDASADSATGLTLTEKEGPEIGSLAEKVDASKLVVSFAEIEAQRDFKVGTFFAVKATFKGKDGNPDQTGWRYFRVTGPRSVMFSKTMYFFEGMFPFRKKESPLDGQKFNFEGGVIIDPQKKATTKEGYFQMCYAFAKVDLGKIFRTGNTVDVKYIEGINRDAVKEEKYTVEKVYWLCKKDAKNKPVLLEMPIDETDLKKWIKKYGTSYSRIPEVPLNGDYARNTDIRTV